jgi:hypothetical protein
MQALIMDNKEIDNNTPVGHPRPKSACRISHTARTLNVREKIRCADFSEHRLARAVFIQTQHVAHKF